MSLLISLSLSISSSLVFDTFPVNIKDKLVHFCFYEIKINKVQSQENGVKEKSCSVHESVCVWGGGMMERMWVLRF